MIESDARAFQSSLKCRLFDPSGNIPFASHAHILMRFDPYEIENMFEYEKKAKKGTCSSLS